MNILGIPPLGKYFNDSADVHETFDDNGTTIKSGSTKSNFVWDHVRHKHHFMHSSSQISELHLFVGHGYYNAFCTHIHKFLKDKVHYAFYLADSIDPQIEMFLPSKPAIISYDNGKWDVEELINEWYHPAIGQPNDTHPTPKTDVTWDDENKPLANDSLEKEVDFKLGMEIVYCDGTGNNVPAVYEGSSANGIKYTILLKYAVRLDANDRNLKLIYQPDFSNITKNPFGYRNEVGIGLSLKEAQALERPCTLSPLKKS